jgi:hypothetical protein
MTTDAFTYPGHARERLKGTERDNQPDDIPNTASVVQFKNFVAWRFAGVTGQCAHRFMECCLSNADDGQLREGFGAGTYDKLAKIETKYDPTNFFRLNQNIEPAVT